MARVANTEEIEKAVTTDAQAVVFGIYVKRKITVGNLVVFSIIWARGVVTDDN